MILITFYLYQMNHDHHIIFIVLHKTLKNVIIVLDVNLFKLRLIILFFLLHLALCTINTYSSSGLEPCIPCPTGTFAANAGSKYCEKCITNSQGPLSLCQGE